MHSLSGIIAMNNRAGSHGVNGQQPIPARMNYKMLFNIAVLAAFVALFAYACACF